MTTTKLDKVRAVRSVDTTERVILPKAQETPTCNNYNNYNNSNN